MRSLKRYQLTGQQRKLKSICRFFHFDPYIGHSLERRPINFAKPKDFRGIIFGVL